MTNQQNPNQNHVVCLKWGDKYSAQYVNRLYAMVKRNLTIDFQFHCMTENPEDLHPEINILPIETNQLTGWWYKLLIFKQDFYGLKGQLLFIDLDMVIIKNLDSFFSDFPNADFCIMSAPGGSKYYGSCMMRLKIGSHPLVWEDFKASSNEIILSLRGDQDWIYEQLPNAQLWPREWIQSYKYHCNSKTKYSFGCLNNLIQPIISGEATLPEKAKVIAFHGKPDPEDIANSYYHKYKKASWINKHWRE